MCFEGLRRGGQFRPNPVQYFLTFGWAHPFVDGSGRVMRVHTHTLLSALGYISGLRSPLRGFVHSTDRCYALLADADGPRRGDLDGRGDPSEQALVAWSDYVLDACLNQAGFMADMLDVETLKARNDACLAFEASVEKLGVRQESLRGLHYLFLSGEEMARGDFKSVLGMSDRGATDALGVLVRRGLLKSDASQGNVWFGLPLHALRFLFSKLWPGAEADAVAK